MILLALYAILFVSRFKDPIPLNIWKSLVLVAGVLVLFNLVKIIPAELKRWSSDVKAASLDIETNLPPVKNSPDIYYIIFDEFAGLQAMREYWQYDRVDDFAGFLKERGFFIAEASHGSSTDTLHQMVTRLNYREYPLGNEYKQTYFNDRADNQVVRYLKSRGYTIVVFDEIGMGYPAAKSLDADYLYEYGESSIPQMETRGYGLYIDEFGELVIDNTMLYVILDLYNKNNPWAIQHSSMISFTTEHLADRDVSSPKFVHVHLLLPHMPFMFDQNGGIADSSNFSNWNYYLNTYIFSISILEKMVVNILGAYDPENPPVIIIQSDHGARNHASQNDENLVLQNYSDEYKTLILNALLIPGYDYASLPQNINPINTFPIIFNHLFDAGIPLVE
jgi:hypothetical protein